MDNINVINRNHNLDLLRLVCMLMVVSIHYFAWGGAYSSPIISKFNYFFSVTIYCFCRVSVDCFFMLSGYLIKDSSDVSFVKLRNKLFQLWIKVFLFSVIVAFLYFANGFRLITVSNLEYTFFPFLKNNYWFISIFFVLIIFRSFFSIALHYINHKTVVELTIILLLINSFQPLLGSKLFGGGSGLLNGIVCLLLGWICKNNEYESEKHINKIWYLSIYIISIVFAGIFAFFEKTVFHGEDASSVDYNSIFIIVGAFCLLKYFASIKMKCYIISKIAPYFLGIYLFNDHPFMREYVYKQILYCDRFYDSMWFPLHWLFCLSIFFIIGVSMDFSISKFINMIKYKF